MTTVRKRGEEIRRYILESIEHNPQNIGKLTAEHFGITRQGINKHLRKLVSEKALSESGHTRNRIYKLASIAEWKRIYEITTALEEDVVWRNDITTVLGPQPANVLDIWQYCFTEMFNNALNHSGGTIIGVNIKKTATSTEIILWDNGIGIFKKIQSEMNLLDERHAILELSKGKLTTDPKHHTGEGIFFTSRMLDSFDILAGGVFFTHKFEDREDWILEAQSGHGTFVWMRLSNHTARTEKEIFDQYVSGEDYGFNKTVVPVKLAQYGNDKLISRSQAKRVLARVELFKTVVFNFKDVESVGQAFADEIFRVFSIEHPGIEVIYINANPSVEQMIQRAQAAKMPRQFISENPSIGDIAKTLEEEPTE